MPRPGTTRSGTIFDTTYRCPDCSTAYSRPEYMRQHIDGSHPRLSASLRPIDRSAHRTMDRYDVQAFRDRGRQGVTYTIEPRQPSASYDRAYRSTSQAYQFTPPGSQRVTPHDERLNDYYGSSSRDHDSHIVDPSGRYSPTYEHYVRTYGEPSYESSSRNGYGHGYGNQSSNSNQGYDYEYNSRYARELASDYLYGPSSAARSRASSRNYDYSRQSQSGQYSPTYEHYVRILGEPSQSSSRNGYGYGYGDSYQIPRYNHGYDGYDYRYSRY